MVKFFPSEETIEDFNGSWGEMALYEAMKDLKGDYYIFHSKEWSTLEPHEGIRYKKRKIHLGENDFLIFNPDRGIIFLEVKDGDIGYSLKKGWIQINRATGEEAAGAVNPMEQAKNAMYFFKEHRLDPLFKEKFAEVGGCPYNLCCAVWFPSGHRSCCPGQLPPEYIEETTFWEEEAKTPEKVQAAIDQVFDIYDCKKGKPRFDPYIRTVLEAVAPDFHCFPSLTSRVKAAELIFHRMTREQEFLLDYLGEQQEAGIHGIAGTGKTVLAQRKAEMLAEESKENNTKVLLLCYNRYLKEHLAEENENPYIDVYNLDALYTLKRQIEPPQNSAEREEAILDFIWSWEDLNMPYHDIIIDEAQDFCNEHLLALRDYVDKKGGCFYAFYDRNQFVQGKVFPEMLDQLECRLVLSRNCRNTAEIAITSTRPIDLDIKKIKTLYDMKTNGMPIRPLLMTDRNEANIGETLAKLIRKYLNAGIKKENIVILTVKTEDESILKNVNPHLAEGITLTHQKNGKHILFTTIRKFKGLEADYVIIVDVDRDTFTDKENRSDFYVGTSRAKMFLAITANDSVAGLAEGLTGTKMSGPKAAKAVRDGLAVKIGTDADLDAGSEQQ